MDISVSGGDLVVAQASKRSEGTSHEYIPENYPAVADFEVTAALKAAGDALSEDVDGKRCHVGVVHSKDSFYGEIEPLQMPVGDKLSDSWSAYVKCGCLTSEMESAAIFSVALARMKTCRRCIHSPLECRKKQRRTSRYCLYGQRQSDKNGSERSKNTYRAGQEKWHLSIFYSTLTEL